MSAPMDQCVHCGETRVAGFGGPHSSRPCPFLEAEHKARLAATGFEERLEGRREMALAAVEHLAVRRISGGEIAEIRTNLLDLVHSLPLGRS